MAAWKACIAAACKADPAAFWRQWLYRAFWIYLALFPIGYGWREVMPPVCLIFLLLYYRHGWTQSNLAKLKARWLFAALYLMAFIGVAFSINPFASAMHVGTALNKGFILPFIAMECAHDEKDLEGLVWALAVACFWQGIDGIWQTIYGKDFIMGYKPNAGRLTGSLGDYTVGNYIALAMVPAWAVWFILHKKFNAPITLLLFIALFWPAFFIFQGASSRSGLIAISAALCLWAAISGKGLKLAWLPALAVILFMIFQPSRITPQSIAGDNRWDLWRLGWQVFMAHPLTGAGAGEYNEAFKSLGLLPIREDPGISHPHNLYLDMLYAHGISGFLAGMTFICGFLWWGWNRIKEPLKKELAEGNQIYWRLTLWFWLGFVAWLANGIFGHDFYRTWWLAQAMIALGIAIGATIAGNRASTL